MEYKPTYTEDDIKELKEWFSSHEYENEIDMGLGIKVLDIKLFVENSMNVVTKYHKNATYSGIIYKLFLLREALIQQGKVKN